MNSPRHLWIACCLSVLTAAAPAAALNQKPQEDDDPYQNVEADTLFKQGVAAMLKLDFETGCPAVARSYELDARLGTLYTLADCEAQRGRSATAVAHFNQFIALVEALPSARQLRYLSRKSRAEKRRAEIEPEVPKVTLTLPPDAPWTTVIKIDGKPIEIGMVGKPLPVDPGPHVFTTEAPGCQMSEVRESVEKAEVKSISLPLQMPAKTCQVVVAPPPAKEAPAGGCAAGCAVGEKDAPPAGALAGLCALVGLIARRTRARNATRVDRTRRR